MFANYPEYASIEFSVRVVVIDLLQHRTKNNNMGSAVGGVDGSALGVEGNTGSNHTNQAISKSDSPDDIDGDIITVRSCSG